MKKRGLPLVLALLCGGAAGLGTITMMRRSPAEQLASGEREESQAMAGGGFAEVPRAAPGAVAEREQAVEKNPAPAGLAGRMSRRSEDLQVVTHPDGRRSVNLGGRFLHMSALVPGPDGVPVARCFSNHEEMAAALSGIPAAANHPAPTR